MKVEALHAGLVEADGRNGALAPVCMGRQAQPGVLSSLRGCVLPSDLPPPGALLELLHQPVRDAHHVLSNLSPFLRPDGIAALEAWGGGVIPCVQRGGCDFRECNDWIEFDLTNAMKKGEASSARKPRGLPTLIEGPTTDDLAGWQRTRQADSGELS